MDSPFENMEFDLTNNEPEESPVAKAKRLSYSSDDDTVVGSSSPVCRGLRAKRLFKFSTPDVSGKAEFEMRGAVPDTPGPLTRFRPRNVSKSSSRFLNAEGRQLLPTTNVNPFTPQGQKTWTRAKRSLIKPLHFMETDDSDEDSPPPRKIPLRQLGISRYTKEFHEIQLIGKGEFGSVYKCVNRLDGCVYAVKKSLLPVAGTVNERGALNEVWANAALGLHSNVVRYFSSWSEEGHVFIQHEYCNGGTLEDLIAENRKNDTVTCETQMKTILLHVAQGLRFLHSKQMAHLDIKPSNIFICRELSSCPSSSNSDADDGFDEVDDDSVVYAVTYKIGDLGHVVSTVLKNVEEGDCRYLPNEVLQEKYSHLTKADIFSLGLTMYQVAGGGELPKNGDEWHVIRQGKLKYLRHYSRELHALMELMIHPDPVQRPSASALLRNPLVNPAWIRLGEQSRKQINTPTPKMQDIPVN